MDYYLDYEASVQPVRCQGERQLLDVRLKLTSTAPEGGIGLPDYVAASVVGLPRGLIRTTISAYAPVGGYVEETHLDDELVPLDRLDLDGRSLVSTTVDVAPGQTRVLRFAMVAGEGQGGRTELRVTPGALGSGVGAVGKPAC